MKNYLLYADVAVGILTAACSGNGASPLPASGSSQEDGSLIRRSCTSSFHCACATARGRRSSCAIHHRAEQLDRQRLCHHFPRRSRVSHDDSRHGRERQGRIRQCDAGIRAGQTAQHGTGRIGPAKRLADAHSPVEIGLERTDGAGNRQLLQHAARYQQLDLPRVAEFGEQSRLSRTGGDATVSSPSF